MIVQYVRMKSRCIALQALERFEQEKFSKLLGGQRVEEEESAARAGHS